MDKLDAQMQKDVRGREEMKEDLQVAVWHSEELEGQQRKLALEGRELRKTLSGTETALAEAGG